MPASLRDVARVAGVSVATASRALNGTGGRAVSPEKQMLIANAVSQLDYRRPEARPRQTRAQATTPRRSNNIGILLRATYRYTDPFWSPVLEGVAEELLQQGYHIRFSYTVDDMIHERRRRLLNAKFIDGLILIGDMGMPDELDGLVPPQHIVVIAGYDSTRWEADLRFNVITMEKHAAMDSLVGHLASLGLRRLAFLGPSPDRDRRGEGFVHALVRHDLQMVPGLFRECDFSTESGYASTRSLLTNNPHGVDGLVCACDTIAIGAVRAAKDLGLQVPADLAIAGFDNIRFSRDLDPPLTTVQVPKELMGELAARRVIDGINHPDWPPIIQMVPTKLIVRASCGESLPSSDRRGASEDRDEVR
jgi:LacI family transcriptional regulator